MATTPTKGAPSQQLNGSAALTEALETNAKSVGEATTKARETAGIWLRKLPLASIGLVAMTADETKVFINKLFMHKLIERGERVQKDAQQWMKDVQARFR